MKNIKHRKIKSLFIILLVAAILSPSFGLFATAENEPKILDGKTISILGDSISTYQNYSNGNAADITNTTIKNNRVFYSNNKNGVGVKDTWWMQIIDKLGGELLVNNSYSNSQIFDPDKNAVSQAYKDRAVNLHDNTGENDGQKPDLILVYMGFNDLAYCKDSLGTFDNVVLDKLISSADGVISYATPKTSVEAYCIMIHKIITAYPDAEVYCFNLSPRSLLNDKNKARLNQFNDAIGRICDLFDCILVDNFNNTGLSYDDANIYCYLADGLHPNRNGMDAITNSFLKAFYENSRYMNPSQILHNVNYELDNIIVDQGTLKTIPEDDYLYCTFSSITGAPAVIQVYIDGIDFTELCSGKDYVYIPRISGKIDVIASQINDNTQEDSYLFTLEDEELKSIIGEENYENTIKLNNGYISESTINNGAFSIEKTIELMHDKAWSIVWKASYNQDYKCLMLSNYGVAEKETNKLLHFIDGTSILSMSEYKNGQYISYGINLENHSIDISENNEYRISNVISADGTNMIYLYVNGKKIGALNHKSENGKLTAEDNNWCNGKDFYYNHIGTSDSTINGCRLKYLQIWENIFNETHKHKTVYINEIEPTCTESGYTEYSCQCGYSTVEITSGSTGHKPSALITDVKATVNSPGECHTECTVCEALLETKIIPQLTPSAPVIKSLTNETNGITIRWGAVEGSDYYRVYRRGEGQKTWQYLGTTTGLSYLDKTVKNNKYWRYTVRSGNEAGYGQYDSTGKYTKFISAPKITGATNTTKGITLKWTAISGAASYSVYRNRIGYTTWTYVGLSKTNTLTDTSIKNASGVDYRYMVKAHYGTGNVYTSGYYATGYTLRRLSTPTLKTAVSYPTGIYINWSQIEGATGYNVYRKTGSGGWKCIGKATPKNPAYFDKTAQKNVRYTYTVRATYNKTLSDFYPKGITIVDKY